MLLRCHFTGPGAIQLNISPDELLVHLLRRREGAEWARGNPPQALTLAKKVVIVPGYGLAVAGAQATVADLVSTLRANGVSVKFAIHPVVGAPPHPSSSFSILPPARTPLWPYRDESDIPCMSACRACAARAAAGTSPGVLHSICFHPGSHMSDGPSPRPSAGPRAEG